jgi:hypothetical protein
MFLGSLPAYTFGYLGLAKVGLQEKSRALTYTNNNYDSRLDQGDMGLVKTCNNELTVIQPEMPHPQDE